MSIWYKLALGNDQDAFEPARQIQQIFMAKFLMTPPGSGRALFSSYDLASDNLWLYFSPAARDIATRVAAQPCDKPAPDAPWACWPARATPWPSRRRWKPRPPDAGTARRGCARRDGSRRPGRR